VLLQRCMLCCQQVQVVLVVCVMRVAAVLQMGMAVQVKDWGEHRGVAPCTWLALLHGLKACKVLLNHAQLTRPQALHGKT
jgi:hypothetical protein